LRSDGGESERDFTTTGKASDRHHRSSQPAKASNKSRKRRRFFLLSSFSGWSLAYQYSTSLFVSLLVSLQWYTVVATKERVEAKKTEEEMKVVGLAALAAATATTASAFSMPASSLTTIRKFPLTFLRPSSLSLSCA